MARSIKQQLSHCVRQSAAYGQSKHAEKNKADGVHHDGRTYAYTSMNSRLDVAKQFGTWMGNAHPEITLAKDITAEHCNEWLSEKAEKCSKATLESYASNLRTLGKQISNTYKIEMNLDPKDIFVPITTKDPIRTVAFQKNDLEKLQKSFETDSLGYRAIVLEKATGCRVEGLSKLDTSDIRILSEERAEVYVHGEKGGRERIVDVVGAENVKNLEHLKKIVPEGQRICPVKPDSINKSFRRHMNKLGMKYDKTTTHAMRKAWAQKRYDEYRKTHTKLETIKYVNVQLGHGAERDVELLGRYVANIH